MVMIVDKTLIPKGQSEAGNRGTDNTKDTKKHKKALTMVDKNKTK